MNHLAIFDHLHAPCCDEMDQVGAYPILTKDCVKSHVFVQGVGDPGMQPGSPGQEATLHGLRVIQCLGALTLANVIVSPCIGLVDFAASITRVCLAGTDGGLVSIGVAGGGDPGDVAWSHVVCPGLDSC